MKPGYIPKNFLRKLERMEDEIIGEFKDNLLEFANKYEADITINTDSGIKFMLKISDNILDKIVTRMLKEEISASKAQKT